MHIIKEIGFTKYLAENEEVLTSKTKAFKVDKTKHILNKWL